MSIVSAENAKNSKVESFGTIGVTDRPKVCENAPALHVRHQVIVLRGVRVVFESEARNIVLLFQLLKLLTSYLTYPSFTTIPLNVTKLALSFSDLVSSSVISAGPDATWFVLNV